MNISLCEKVMNSWHIYFIYIVICVFPTNCKKNCFRKIDHSCVVPSSPDKVYSFDVVLTVHLRQYVEIKCQLDATEVFIADLIAC